MQKMCDGAHISLGSLEGLPLLHLLFHFFFLGDHDIREPCIFLHCLCVAGVRIHLVNSVAGADLFPSPRGKILGIKREWGSVVTCGLQILLELVPTSGCYVLSPVLRSSWISTVTCNSHRGGARSNYACLLMFLLFVCLSSASYLQPLLLPPNTTSTINMLSLGKKSQSGATHNLID